MARIVDEAIDYLTERDTHIPPLVAVLALVGLGRIARVASFGLAALWLADQMRTIDRDLVRPYRLKDSQKVKQDQAVDEAMEESFPASDAPSYSPTISGRPEAVSNMARLRTVH